MKSIKINHCKYFVDSIFFRPITFIMNSICRHYLINIIAFSSGCMESYSNELAMVHMGHLRLEIAMKGFVIFKNVSKHKRTSLHKRNDSSRKKLS